MNYVFFLVPGCGLRGVRRSRTLDCFVGAHGLSLYQTRGDEVLAAALESHAGQRPRRRAGDHRAVGGGKCALVAGTSEDIIFGMIKHGAGSVRAGAAEGQKGVRRGVDQDAGLNVGRISKNFRAADGNFRGLRDDAHGIFFRQAAEKLPRGCSQAEECGPNEQLDYFPARGFRIFLNADGESFPVRY